MIPLSMNPSTFDLSLPSLPVTVILNHTRCLATLGFHLYKADLVLFGQESISFSRSILGKITIITLLATLVT